MCYKKRGEGMAAGMLVMSTALGTFLEEQRQDRQWTYRDLEDSTGVSRSALYDMKSGKTEAPKLQSLARIARGLGIPLVKLIEVVGFDPGVNDDLLSAVQRQRLSRLTPEQLQEIVDLADRLWPPEQDPRR